jgi:penicillin-binding protein 1A
MSLALTTNTMAATPSSTSRTPQPIQTGRPQPEARAARGAGPKGRGDRGGWTGGSTMSRVYNPDVPDARVRTVPRTDPPPPPTSRPPRRWRRWLWPLLAAAALGGVLGIAGAAAVHVPNVDEIARYSPKLITRLLDRQGNVFSTYALERRLLLREGEVPPLLQNAVLAAEDSEFFRHGGIDLLGVVRSFAVNFQRGRRAQGASTITMQLARELTGRREKTWNRKITEALLAVELEKRLSKQQILTLYCNLAFLGHGNYGMEAAARDYFGHGVRDLSLTEAATLAGIVQRPSDFSPYRAPERVVARRNYVLRRMYEEGFIDRPAHDAAVLQPLGLARQREAQDLGPYFAEAVRRHLEETYGSERLYTEGFEVRTTLDERIQRAAEAALSAGLQRIDHRRGWRGPVRRGESQLLTAQEIEEHAGRNPRPETWVPGLVLAVNADAAAVRTPAGDIRIEREGVAWTRRNEVSAVLRQGDLAWFRESTDPEAKRPPRWELEQEPVVEGTAIVLESATGAVRALVGGWDFQRSKFDRATQAARQVGSAFKPFVFGAAIEAGYTPSDHLFDAPAVFTGADGLPSYSPRNYYRRYNGIITLESALEHSVNVPAVKLLDLLGVQHVIDFARRCGITSSLPPYPSLALGSADLIPMELAAAYATVANQGILVRPYLVEEVKRPDGATLERHALEPSKAMEPAVAYVLAHMLEGVVDRGTAARLSDLPLALAGKTGTTNDYTDAWFVGFSPRYTMLVWVGFDQKRTLGDRMTGAEAALPAWRLIAEAGLRDGWLTEGETFAVPPGVELRPVDAASGLAAAPGSAHVIEEAFLAGTAPTETWTPRWDSILALPWSQQLAFYHPRQGEKMPGDDPAEVEALAAAQTGGEAGD